MTPFDTLPAAFGAVVEASPDALALIDTGHSPATRLTFAGLGAEVARAASMLTGQLALRRGDTVCNWLPNMTESVVLQLAAAHLGLLTVNLNTRYRSSELAHVLRTTNAAALVLPSDFLSIDFVGIARDVLGSATPYDWGARWPALRGVIAVDTSSRRHAGDGPGPVPGRLATIDWASAVRAYDEAPLEPGRAAGPEDLLVGFNTSGTTGSPKLAVHTHRSVAMHSGNVARAFDLCPGDRLLAALPLCGAFGFTGAMAALLAGAGLVLQSAFDAHEAVRWFQDEQITHAYGPDNLLGAIADAAAAPADLVSWRGAAFANFSGDGVRVAERIETSFGVPMRGVYGASEILAMVSVWPSESDPAVRHQSGGVPVSPDIGVRAVSQADGTVLGHDEDGELQFRGYPVMAGYHGDEEATRAAFTHDGWFRSGDLGRTRSDGSFVYLSRLGDRLRLGGFLVDPAEIETLLLVHDQVHAAAVVGVERPGVGDVAVAFVEGEAGLDPEVVLDWIRGRTAGFKVPAHLVQLDELPRVEGPNGMKIRRTDLRRLAGALVEVPAPPV